MVNRFPPPAADWAQTLGQFGPFTVAKPDCGVLLFCFILSQIQLSPACALTARLPNWLRSIAAMRQQSSGLITLPVTQWVELGSGAPSRGELTHQIVLAMITRDKAETVVKPLL